MIKSNLSRLMGEKRLRVQDICRATSLARNTVTNLYKDTAEMVRYDTLSALCMALNCTVGDILEYVPDEEPRDTTVIPSADGDQ